MSYRTSTVWAKGISYGGTRSASEIHYIVLHYTGNETDTALANANYFGPNGSNTRAAGAHYFVDETHVVQSIADTRIAWSVGGSKYANCGATGGGSLYGVVTNANSLSIEMCSQHGAIPAATVRNAAELTRRLMKQYRIPASHVVRHFDVTGKDCPGWYGWNGRGTSGKWEQFRQLLTLPEPTAVVTAGPVHLRLRAGKKHPVVGTLNAGVRLHVTQSTEHWTQVSLWVPSKQLKTDD